MRFSKYGLDVLIPSMLAIVAVCLLAGFFISNVYARITVYIVAAVTAGLILNFFRDPERTTSRDANIVVSPADGRVVTITKLVEDEYIKSEAVQVSIFMSPLNVHVNRFPISGTVEYFRHVQGEYLVAFDEKSSLRNERTLIGVRNDGFKVLFKQIAGAVARRIVAPVSVGQPAVAGERFGMIKFGSRVDVIMPPHAELQVQLNDRVVAGETILARYSPTQHSS